MPNRVNGLFPKSNQLSVQSIFCASFYLLAGRNCADYIRGVRFSACVTNAPLLWKSSAKNSKAKVTIKIKQHKPNEMQSLHCNAPILWSGSKRPYSRRKFLKPLSLLMITFFACRRGILMPSLSKCIRGLWMTIFIQPFPIMFIKFTKFRSSRVMILFKFLSTHIVT